MAESDLSARPGEAVVVGVAVPVPSPWREVLDQARIASGDPFGETVPAHLTLLGPTEIDAGDLAAAQARLDEVSAAFGPFNLHLRGTGSFRPVTEVVFVAVVDGIAGCERLEAAIRSGPMARERSFPYHPHITVAQNVPSEALDWAFDELSGFEAKFPVASFTLYTHPSPGNPEAAAVPWTPTKVYPLTGT